MLVVCLMCSQSSALVIYRFGGESLPPPSELSAEGGEDVQFVQLRWADVHATRGGSAFQLDMDEQGIRALEYDPEVNIAPGFLERGGHLGRNIWTSGDKYAPAFDGDHDTAWLASRYLCADSVWACNEYASPGAFEITLGGSFLIDRLRIVSGLSDPSATVVNILMNVGGEFEIRDNKEQFRVVPITHDRRVSAIMMTLAEHDRPLEVGEVEVYARGFAEKSTYVSDVIDFGGLAAWGEMRWSGFRESGAELLVRTRSGADEDPVIYWKYTGRGDERVPVPGSSYDGLSLGQKAGTTHDLANWAFWSEAYDFADSTGAAVVSLSPRRYLQLKVDMVPASAAGSGLSFLELRASTPPVASGLVGEIYPFEVHAGEVSRFTYALKPTLKSNDTGFDRLQMRTTTSRLLSVESVTVDQVAVPFVVEALDETVFDISFARVTREQDSGAVIEVVFDAQVLRYGSTFDAWVFDSNRPLEVPQAVSAGDATLDYDGNTVAVITSVDKLSLLELTVSPRVLTPNGDGVNDVAQLRYDLLESVGDMSVTIEIHDLAGRLIRQVYSGTEGIGHYDREWDGKDEQGVRVAPGVYLYRVSVGADDDRFTRVGLLPVAY
mgnify:CR=1 FL=1